MSKPARRRIAVVAALLLVAGCGHPPAPPAQSRVVVVGFDGLDPTLTERWMADGTLPHFAALAQRGHYQRLATTNPPQSPVAWASFATGRNPGEHGIFDFLRRDAATYQPDFSIATNHPPEHVLRAFGWDLPLDGGSVTRRRDGEPFWLAAEHAGDRATVLRVPVTYPPDPVSHMIAGMGVPDLLGSQGTYTLFATRPMPGADNGGRVELVQIGDDGVIRTQLDGPSHPLKPAAPALSVPLNLSATTGGAALDIDGQHIALGNQTWSPWIHLHFSYGLGSVAGSVRVFLLEAFPRPLLYVSPINIDPTDPVAAISAPTDYAGELAARIGDFHTLGMPEETWALNQGHMSEQGWLDLVRTTLGEGEAMLDDALKRRDSELVIEVFVQTDRVSHMFWRGFDAGHPGYAASSELARGAVPWIYREADRVLGHVQEQLGPKDKLVVLSDHGFASFRRAAHVNRWLADHGYLVLKPGADGNQPLFAAVDWSKSRAYALGLNGVYVNLRGREAQGIVATDDATALRETLRQEMQAWQDQDGARIVDEVFDSATLYHGAHVGDAPDLVIGYAPGYRASWQTTLGATPKSLVEDNLQPWSGDHCIDPAAVPGVLFTSFPLQVDAAGIGDVGALIRQQLPERIPGP